IELKLMNICGGILMICTKSGVVKSFILFLVLIILICSSIVSNTLAQEDISHETLNIVISGPIQGPDARVIGNRNVAWIATQYQGYLGMLAPGETTVTLPGIAKNWTCNDDRTEWTFTLREGVTFHDGTVIDAKTVKYSVDANYMAQMAYFAELYSRDDLLINISQAARQLEDEGLNITFPSNDPNGNGQIVTFSGTWFPDPKFEWDVCCAGSRFMLVPYESHGRYTDDVATCQAKLESFSQAPISAGPYQFVDWVPDKYLLLERFDDWFGWGESFSVSNGEVYSFPRLEDGFKFLNFSTEDDNALAVDQLVSEKLDLVIDLKPTSDVRETINSYNNVSFYVIDQYLSFDGIWMNIQGDYPEYLGGPGNFPVSQVWFRQAVSHALNRTKLVETFDPTGVDTPRTTWFPDWLANMFPDLDTTDYYDFDQGKEEAITLLDEAGYQPNSLAFAEEPTNRFGWGVYANETHIDGVEQTKGRHFKLPTFAAEWTILRAEAIKNELEQVGIFVDILPCDWETLSFLLYWSGDPGYSYNTSYNPQRDPTFTGPDWDFAIFGLGGGYDIPNAYLADLYWDSFINWYKFGRGFASWWNENSEINVAKIFGGKPVDGLLGIPDPPDMPPSGYPVPVWENDDPQYIEACEQVGFEMSKELPYVPLSNYGAAYALNNHIKNFKMSSTWDFTLAYSYWTTEDNGKTEIGTESGTTTDSPTDAYGIFIPLTVLFLLTIQLQSHKKRKKI
ncbi:MAG: ABC transporter substrate-binding protein, partial [Promethearchaeota archaeon]